MNRVKQQFISEEGILLVKAGVLGDDLKLTKRGFRILSSILVEKYLRELVVIAKQIVEAKNQNGEE